MTLHCTLRSYFLHQQLVSAASAVSETAFSDLVARNVPQVERLMQKKNMQGLIDLSYELDVSPFLEKLQRYNLVLKLNINKLSPTEAITLVFKSAFLQSFRLTMPGTVLLTLLVLFSESALLTRLTVPGCRCAAQPGRQCAGRAGVAV
jgi:hypothetical protein